METKKCNVCGETKPLAEFYRHAKSPDGHGYTCKPCSKARARQWAKDHPDRHLKTMHRHMQTERYQQTRRALRSRKSDELQGQRRDWYARNRDQINAKARERRRIDPEYRERQNARARSWVQKNRQARQDWHREFLYGLSREAYDAMVIAQLGRCAICDEPGDLVVDHDHASDPESPRVRGLLCPRCNHGLGHFRDNPDFLMGAVAYLKAAIT